MSTEQKTIRWLGAALLFGVLAGGIPYWPVAYTDVDLTDSSLIVQWSLFIAAAAGIISAISPLGPFKSAVVTGSGLPTAVLLRIAVDVYADPTSHNLWPLEMVIASVITILPALIGSYIGFAARSSLQKK